MTNLPAKGDASRRFAIGGRVFRPCRRLIQIHALFGERSQSGKQKLSDPYATLMKVPARRATSFGHVKATEVGDKSLNAVPRFALPQLTEWATAFRVANDALKASGRVMADAEDALDDPRFGKRGLVRRINALVAVTEAFILTAYPGRAALADAILVPSWAKRKAKAQDDATTGDDNEVDPEADEV